VDDDSLLAIELQLEQMQIHSEKPPAASSNAPHETMPNSTPSDQPPVFSTEVTPFSTYTPDIDQLFQRELRRYYDRVALNQQRPPPHPPIGVTTLRDQRRCHDRAWKESFSADRPHKHRIVYHVKGGTLSATMRHYRHLVATMTTEALLRCRLRTIDVECTLYDHNNPVIDSSGQLRTLHAIIDLVALDEQSGRLCVIDVKTNMPNSGTGYSFSEVLHRRASVIQLRLYALILKRVLCLSYAPKLYLLCIRPESAEAQVCAWTLTNEDLYDATTASSIYPHTYHPILSSKLSYSSTLDKNSSLCTGLESPRQESNSDTVIQSD